MEVGTTGEEDRRGRRVGINGEARSAFGVSGGDKVGQWSGGAVPPRGGVITGHWLG